MIVESQLDRLLELAAKCDAMLDEALTTRDMLVLIPRRSLLALRIAALAKQVHQTSPTAADYLRQRGYLG